MPWARIKRVAVPGSLTVCLHVALAVAMMSTRSCVKATKPPRQKPVEVEVVPPPPQPEQPPPAPKPAAKTPTPVPPKPKPERHRPRTHKRGKAPPKKSKAPEQPKGPTPKWVQPGKKTAQPSPPVYSLDKNPASGSVPVSQGTLPPGAGGGGGGGGGRGGGGGGGGRGGSGPPQPVSIAALSKLPEPIGNTDFMDISKHYPPEARRRGIEGPVKVRLIVDAHGHVADRHLICKRSEGTCLGYGLDKLAMRLADKLRFKPARDHSGRAVPAQITWTFHFTLPK